MPGRGTEKNRSHVSLALIKGRVGMSYIVDVDCSEMLQESQHCSFLVLASRSFYGLDRFCHHLPEQVSVKNPKGFELTPIYSFPFSE